MTKVKAYEDLVLFGLAWRRRVGVENITDRNLKDLEEMLGNTKSLKRNNRKYTGILMVPSGDNAEHIRVSVTSCSQPVWLSAVIRKLQIGRGFIVLWPSRRLEALGATFSSGQLPMSRSKPPAPELVFSAVVSLLSRSVSEISHLMAPGRAFLIRVASRNPMGS